MKCEIKPELECINNKDCVNCKTYAQSWIEMLKNWNYNK